VSFSQDLTNCNGAVPSIIATRTCTIPVGVLRAEPFSIEWGESIWVKVGANNIIGAGPLSVEGNGAVMLTTPDPPINLSNVPALTSSSQIGLSWEPSPNDGGAEVIDYTLMWDRATGNFEIYDMFIT
jgi:hypothetical protein